MSSTNPTIRPTGAAAVAAGLCYLPLVLIDGWQSIAAVGQPTWWIVIGLATLHHVFLLFALLGVFVVGVRRPGFSGLAAFVTASTGNLLVTGVGAVQLTVLPALASHPTAAAGLDCTPFFTAATAAGRALTAAACEPWDFAALGLWVSVAWPILIAGSLWIAVEIFRGQVLAKPAAGLLAAGSIVQLAGFAAPLPSLVGRAAYLALVAAWVWLGAGLWRAGSR